MIWKYPWQANSNLNPKPMGVDNKWSTHHGVKSTGAMMNDGTI